MKKAFFSLFVLLPLFGFSQSDLSNKPIKYGDWIKGPEELFQKPDTEQYYNQGMELYKKGDYKGAVECFEKSGRQTVDYAFALVDYAGQLSGNSDFERAFDYQCLAVRIFIDSLGGNYYETIEAANLWAIYSYRCNRIDYATQIGLDVIKLYKTYFSETDANYGNYCMNYARYCEAAGNYTEAIEYSKKHIEICEKLEGTNSNSYIEELCNQCNDYCFLYNRSKANMKFELARNYIDSAGMIVDLLNLKTIGAYNIYNNRALSAAMFDDAESAINYSRKAIEIAKCLEGEAGRQCYFTEIVSLAGYYAGIGKDDEAIEILEKAKEIDKNKDRVYVCLLHNLALSYNNLGKFQKGLEFSEQAVKLSEELAIPDTSIHLAALEGLLWALCRTNSYDKAIPYINKGYDLIKYNANTKLFNIELDKVVRWQRISCDAFFLNGYSEEGIKIMTQTLPLLSKFGGSDNGLYISMKLELVEFYYRAGDFAKVEENAQDVFNLLTNYVRARFSTMTAQERNNFWHKSTDAYSNFCNLSLPYYALKNNSETSLAIAYDALLFAKGLTLNAEIEIQNLIEKNGDKLLTERYQQLRANRTLLDQLYQVEPNRRMINTDSLRAVVEQQEKAIVASSKELGDYTRNLSITWKDVQNNLTAKDIAIEFADFYDDNQHVYVALILKKGMKTPGLVKLFTDKELKNVYLSDYYKTPKVTNLVWQPMQQYLNGVENVYFSPVGALHTIGIEYLPDENGEIFAQKYNAYRLSSTRELALPKADNQNLLASVYGGIIYDFSKGDWDDLRSYKDEIVAEFRDLPDLTDETKRAGLSFLQGAKVESEVVSGILHNGNYKVSESSDVYATEESFKKLSGSGIKILHIATHGFYEPENKKRAESSNILLTNDKTSKEDRSLSRSGLFLAGAASALDPNKRKDIPDGVDDGILTAKEISRLDFNGLDLVVLSACQTGLGDVTSDGVFGLQRGFKKAGAQTIVMSLWSVSDEATKDLMTEFYNNMMAGKSKREAFVLSQTKLRQKYPDPQKWAAFIMVDGMEN